jgi:hypothetical protein
MFKQGKKYKFKVAKGRHTKRGYRDVAMKYEFIRYVNKLSLFISVAGRWMETFTREQLADHEIEEAR